MYTKTVMAFCLVAILSFVSCSKSKDDPKPDLPIEGKWVGEYSVLSGPYDKFYSFNIKPGGILELLNDAGQKTGVGTWKLDGIIFEGTYDYGGPDGKFSVLGTFRKEKDELDGTWGVGSKEYGGGYWYMERGN